MALKYSSSCNIGGAFLSSLDLRGSKRGPLTAEVAKVLVSKVVLGEDIEATKYERIILSTWALSEDSVAEIVAALPFLPNLTSFVLADIIAGRPEAEGLSVYRALCSALTSTSSPSGDQTPICDRIVELDLSDNAVGTKGVEACRPLLQQLPSLKRLFFCNCGISAEAARTITDYLVQGKRSKVVTTTPGSDSSSSDNVSKNEGNESINDGGLNLEVLHFDNNMSGGAGAAALGDLISASPKLLDFKYTSSRGDRSGVEALCAAIATARNLQKLDLHDNIFAEPLGLALGSSLSGLRNLVHLDLGDTLLRDDGVLGLASGLLNGCALSLEHLDLSCNEITNKGAVAVAKCVTGLKRLRVLMLQENEFEDKGVKLIAKALKLRNSDGGSANVVSQQTDEEDEDKRRLAQQNVDVIQLVSEEDPLEHIDLSSNMISSSSAVAVTRSCVSSKLKKLKVLKLSGNDDVSLACAQRIGAILLAGGIGSIEEEVFIGELDEFEEGDDDGEEEEEDGE